MMTIIQDHTLKTSIPIACKTVKFPTNIPFLACSNLGDLLSITMLSRDSHISSPKNVVRVTFHTSREGPLHTMANH